MALNKSKKYKVGDDVVVNAGKDKGKRGKITVVLSNGTMKVEGVNMRTYHEKPNPQRNTAGGRKQVEAPVHHSNLSHWNPALGQGDRVGFKFLEDGSKVRYFKSNNELVDL